MKDTMAEPGLWFRFWNARFSAAYGGLADMAIYEYTP
jgi:hypothetical protein